MEKVRLGKTELRVSRVGFGGIPIQRLSEPKAVAVVRHSLGLGVTFIDTANGYTTSEARIGKAIAGWPRDELVIATKTGARDRETAMAHLEQSFTSLQTDYLDLWQFHNVSTMGAYERVLGPGGAMEAAQMALQSGRVRHVGISSHSMDVALIAVSSGRFETIQFPFNFVTSEPLDALIPLAHKHDLGFIAMKPFAGGLLHKANIAIKFQLEFDVVPDPGIETVDEIEEIVSIVNGERAMTAGERVEMERIRTELGTRFCRRCDYCQPCPQEIRISTVMNVRSFWRRFPAQRFKAGGIARAMDRARDCLECGECEERCPYQLPIREMIKENVAFFDRIAD
jgi:predicted aldo/keto reductase-like oxidoreductase